MNLKLSGTKRRNLSLRYKRSRLAIERLEARLNLALDVPVFSSLPGANHTIYLDFDGHVTSGTSWNNGATINSPAYSSDADTANFSPSERLVIERTFYRVAEDFAPFQVNVSTVAPSVDDLRNMGGTDSKWGIRVVVTRDVAFNCGCGGGNIGEYWGHPYKYCVDSCVLVDFQDVHFISIQLAFAGGTYG